MSITGLTPKNLTQNLNAPHKNSSATAPSTATKNSSFEAALQGKRDKGQIAAATRFHDTQASVHQPDLQHRKVVFEKVVQKILSDPTNPYSKLPPSAFKDMVSSIAQQLSESPVPLPTGLGGVDYTVRG